jgi:3-hydroxyisobutyrate dehydrogenase
MATVGFRGTGLLGGAMVEGFLRRGDTVTVWNRTEAKARGLEQAGTQPLTVLPAIARRMDAAIAKGHGHEDLGVIAAEVVR